MVTGTDVECTGVDTDGFTSSTSGLSIEVLGGAIVENINDDAFELANTNNQSIINGGEIFSEFDRGIDVEDGDNLDVLNFGTIDGDNDAIRGDDNMSVTNAFGGEILSFSERGIDADDDLYVENEGFIESFKDAIDADNDAEIINSGLITSFTEEGVDAGDGLDLNNSGIIDVGGEGVQAGFGATIVNQEGGVIFALNDGIQVAGDADITNSGQIGSLDEDGIDVDSGVIRNTATGLIGGIGFGAGGIDIDDIPDEDKSDYTTLEVEIDNAGLILGDVGILVDPMNDQTQTVRNSGVIAGFFGVGVDLGAADDFMAMIGDGEVFGDVLLGDGDDILDVSMASSGLVGGFAAFFDGGSEVTGDLIDFGATRTQADIIGFDDRDPTRMRLVFSGMDGRTTVLFTDFELFKFGADTLTVSDISGTVPVPVPATAGFLLIALGALGVSRRYRA